VADPELVRRVRRIQAIRKELAALYAETHPSPTRGTIGLWLTSVGLCVAGLLLTPPVGAIALALASGSVLLAMIDTARQIQTAARTREQRKHAERLEQELLDHLAFIQNFGRLR
jgi:hypothetical protein